jgi:hypothetical protein
MKKGYTVSLVARAEGLEYRDEFGVFRFNVTKTNKTWVVFLPGSKGDFYETHELSETEQERIFPRITRYLGTRRYFGFFGTTDPVVFEREPPVSAQVAQSRRRAAEYWKKQREQAFEKS